MRLIRCIVLTMTAASCIALLLFCAFLEDEHSTMPVLMPANVYPSVANTPSSPFPASIINKPRTQPQVNKHIKTQQSTSNISSNTTRTISPFTTFSVIASSTSKGRTMDPQSTTTSISSNTPSQWTPKMEEMVRNRYELRKKLLTERCNTTSGYPEEEEKEEEERKGLLAMPRLSYYVRKYKLFSCVPAKSGATTWKIHFLRMNGYKNPIEMPHLDWVHRMIRARQVLRRRQADKVLNSPLFARVISVRHPVSRLISGYNNKFHYGRVHIPNPVTSRFVKSVMEMEGTTFREGQPVAVTFRQFLNLILHEKKKGLENINNHWRPQYDLCYACSVSYNYMVKQETFEEDLQYLFKKLNITEVNISLKTNVFGRPPNITYEEYFRDIPKGILREIFDLYRLDFLLFGYEVPKFLKDILPPER